MVHIVHRSKAIDLEKSQVTQVVTGFDISVLSFDGQIEAIMQWAQARLSKMVCVSNVHMLMEGHWSQEFAKVLKTADMLTPDGMPLVWMTSLMKGQRQDRVAGMDLMLALCNQAQTHNVSIFLLGSTPEILSQICLQISEDFPGLKVSGMVSPPFRPLSSEEDAEIVKQINESGAGLVFVSLGCPKQERWMHHHQGQVNAVMVGLGGVFPIYAGIKRWAPKWVRQLGLEWLYRLRQEPKRLWKRYATTIPPFLWLALKQVIKLRFGITQNISFRENYSRRDHTFDKMR